MNIKMNINQIIHCHHQLIILCYSDIYIEIINNLKGLLLPRINYLLPKWTNFFFQNRQQWKFCFHNTSTFSLLPNLVV